MELDLGQKLNKIYLASKELETNLFDYHAKITEYVGANDGPAKIETYIEKSSICLQKIIEEMMSLNLCLCTATTLLKQYINLSFT